MATKIKGKACPNKDCGLKGMFGQGNIRTHGWYKTKTSRRRRYKCNACGKTFGSTHGTAYYRLRGSRQEIDNTCHMSAEGMNISAIGRIMKHTWNTVDRWLERARKACYNFQNKHLCGYEINEVQADELKTHVGPCKHKTWILAIIEVGSRLWPAVSVGSRSYKNIRDLFGKAFHKGNIENKVFVTTDGFFPYGWVLKRILGSACLYGQVVKKRKKNRVTKVERKIVLVSKQQVEDALFESEDSEKLNTSFIERLNLTIRRNTSYLHRKTPAHSMYGNRLAGQLELQRCYYNFMRPHMALKFGSETYTPDMMAKISDRKLSWRDILEGRAVNLFVLIFSVADYSENRPKIAA